MSSVLIDNTNILVGNDHLIDYETKIEELTDIDVDDDVITAKDTISLFLQDLAFSENHTSDYINNLDNSYNKFYSDLKRSNDINNKLKQVVSKYQSNRSKNFKF